MTLKSLKVLTLSLLVFAVSATVVSTIIARRIKQERFERRSRIERMTSELKAARCVFEPRDDEKLMACMEHLIDGAKPVAFIKAMHPECACIYHDMQPELDKTLEGGRR